MIKADIFNEEEIRNRIIKLAKEKQGFKYEHNMYGPTYFDCAGFVWYIYNQVMGINIFKGGVGKSTTTKVMTGKFGYLRIFDEDSIIESKLNVTLPGDILLFHTQSLKKKMPEDDNKYPGHAGIYLGNNEFIHCSSKRKEVLIMNFDDEYWQKKLVASKDMITNNKIKKKIKLK